ncbi:hypothetical protein D9M70_595510 [compost metagenome]
MMSGMAASCSQPSAQVSITLVVSFRRSTIGSLKPAARARSRSLAFSVCKPSTLARNRAASPRNALSLVAALALAISAEAALAWLPIVFMSSVVEVAFMP